MKNFFISHILFIVFILVLAIYLGLKTLPEDGWDDWGFGSAQTLMTMKHWSEDGMIYSKFLFIPIGYSKTVRYLDEPEMRHHAQGIIIGELIGSRLYYTHYPAGYLVPYGVLTKIGFEGRHWFRLFALVLSLAALTLMYSLFSLISTRVIAFLATLYYAGSTMFLGLADSLANQPVDDFFRFLILFISILATREVSQKRYMLYNVFIWVFYFILAGSSYDSTLFIFVWLVGLDIITAKNFLWKKWLFFASAPIAAFAIQMAQNAWYLGLKDALLDTYGSFRFRAGSGPGSNILERHVRAMFSPLVYMTDIRDGFIIPIIAAIFVILRRLKSLIPYDWPKISLLILFALAGFTYPFIFTSSGYFPYQGRQMAPFVGLLIASSTVLLFLILRNLGNIRDKISKIKAVLLVVLLVLTGALWISQAKRTYAYILDWPNNQVERTVINFAESLKEIAGDRDAVVFRIDEIHPYRYPQLYPIVEYYIGMPVLSFKNISDLIRDFEWLRNRSGFAFHPIIVVNNEKEAEEIKELIGQSDEFSILIQPDPKMVFYTSAH